MPTIPPSKQQWYVVHVLSGQEQKVAKRIRALTEQEELKDKIYEVLVPCLLYTSPSPRDRTRSRMPSSA